ncbi:MAG: multicopper oxidase domain-containing protein [Nitrosomonas sp.]|nr:multicopper oxidase domain-containing protein [Nitrosomonas sp.]
MSQKKLKLNGFAIVVIMLLVLTSSSVLAATRVYWISADEVDWDYAPSFPINRMSGNEFTPEQRVFVEDEIGRRYLKSVYREYTKGFGALKQRGEREQHLGILGPVIRAKVGDKIVVHFRNNTRFPANIHPHGVLYTKAHEGSAYHDGDSNKIDDIVVPGGEYTYQWEVPHRAGPGDNDPSSIAWIYHSHVDEPADTNSGLIGAIIITRHGAALKDGSPKEVDREFVSLFTVFDENASLYLDANMSRCGGICDPDDESFQESNLMHGINGLVYGNNQGYVMHRGERVRWYILGMGTEVDLHTPHWHGATLLHNGNRLDVTEILPAATKTLDMRPDVNGAWMYHCHVNDHISAGMMSIFTVK